MNEKTGGVCSGQVEAPKDFDYRILKFDGVKDTSLGNPAGYGLIEFVYHLMAKAAGIHMTECLLLKKVRLTTPSQRPGSYHHSAEFSLKNVEYR